MSEPLRDREEAAGTATEAAKAAFIAAARAKAHTLYDGVVTPHRSCGIALAETFGRRTEAYQALRRGGVLGLGECGAIVAGRLLIGEFFGDPDPTGAVTPALMDAMAAFERKWHARVTRGAAPGESIVCNVLTGQFAGNLASGSEADPTRGLREREFATFKSPERHRFCTDLATEVATCVAEVLAEHGMLPAVTPVAGGPT